MEPEGRVLGGGVSVGEEAGVAPPTRARRARRARLRALDLTLKASAAQPFAHRDSWTMLLVLGRTQGLPTGWPWRPSEGEQGRVLGGWWRVDWRGLKARSHQRSLGSRQALREALSQWNARKKW